MAERKSGDKTPQERLHIKLTDYDLIEVSPGIYEINGGEKITKKEMLDFIQKLIDSAPNKDSRILLMDVKNRLEDEVKLRDFSSLKQVLPVSGAILERMARLDYQFKLRHPNGSFKDALKSPDLTGQVMALSLLYFVIGLPEMGLASFVYLANGVRKGEW